VLKDQWVRKYRPQNLSEYVFQDEMQRQKIQEYIDTKTIPHLLFYGIAGTGKTSLAQLLIKNMPVEPEMDVLEINSSDHNSVDDIRNLVMHFVKTSAMGAFKIVHLKECDRLSAAAQDALKDVTEQYDQHCRFIMTCNHIHKVTPELRSRVTSYGFRSPNKDSIIERVINILLAEGIEPNEYMLDYIDNGYPDIRNIIQSLENGIVNGVLIKPSSATKGTFYNDIMQHLSNDDWESARTVACNNISSEEWEDLYTHLYTNLLEIPKFKKDPQKYETGILTIASFLLAHSQIADPEINVCAMFITLCQI